MKELILPWPDKRLSPNARVHWSKRSGAARLARHLGAITALEAGCKGWELPSGRLHLHVTFHPPTKLMPDDDNMLARFKPYRDGIADALGIDDKRFISHPLVSTEVRKGGQVVVRITGGPGGMSRAQQIREWLAANPGWHFAADVCDGLEITTADDRAKHARSLSNMVTLGLLDGVGRRRFMKYRANRNAYYRPTEGNA